MKYHLRNWKCHYYSYEGGGSKKTILSLIKHVTLSLRRVGVKGISDNVTKYDVFFCEFVPNSFNNSNNANKMLMND